MVNMRNFKSFVTVLHEKDGRSSLLNDASLNKDTSLSADQCQENSEFNGELSLGEK